MTAEYDWTQFTRHLFVKADLSQVFNAWVVPAELERWFIAEARYTQSDSTPRSAQAPVQPGDQYYWRWHQDADIRGEVLSVIENELFQFSFGTNSAGETIIVTVHFYREADETLIELTQQNMTNAPTDQVSWHLSCNLGWSFFMTNLKAWLEHGIDLRETSQQRAATTRAISTKPLSIANG